MHATVYFVALCFGGRTSSKTRGRESAKKCVKPSGQVERRPGLVEGSAPPEGTVRVDSSSRLGWAVPGLRWGWKRGDEKGLRNQVSMASLPLSASKSWTT